MTDGEVGGDGMNCARGGRSQGDCRSRPGKSAVSDPRGCHRPGGPPNVGLIKGQPLIATPGEGV